MAISKLRASHQILELRAKLASTDYKIIKCYEARLQNQPDPYDVAELTNLRQSWRNIITSLEKEIETINNEVKK
jgi:hypothetical protein